MNIGFIGSGDRIKSVEDVDTIITHEYGLLHPVYFYVEDGMEKSAPVSNEALTGDEIGTLYCYLPPEPAEFVKQWCRKYGVEFIDRSSDNISYWLDAYAYEAGEDYVDEDYTAEDEVGKEEKYPFATPEEYDAYVAAVTGPVADREQADQGQDVEEQPVKAKSRKKKATDEDPDPFSDNPVSL